MPRRTATSKSRKVTEGRVLLFPAVRGSRADHPAGSGRPPALRQPVADGEGGTPPRGASRPAPGLSPRLRVRRAVALLLLALALPGSAQWLAGRRRLGRAVLVGVAAVTGLALLLGIVALADAGAILGLFTDSTVLRLLAVLLVVLGLGQAALLADAWRLGRPATLPRRARPAVAAATALAVLLVATGAVAGARRAWAGASLLDDVFHD